MRDAAILVLAGTLALFAGCDRVAALTAAGNLQAFESRCAKLPPGRVDVIRAPTAMSVDATRSGDELERLFETNSSRHRTVGVTTASFGYRTTIDIDGLEDARGARACARPRVRIEIALTPMTVYVAREFREDACRKPLILEHEHRHVDVFERYADEVASELSLDLSAHLGEQVLHGPTMVSIQQAVQEDLAAWLEAFMDRASSELAGRNAAIDTVDEYGKLERVCGPAS